MNHGSAVPKDVDAGKITRDGQACIDQMRAERAQEAREYREREVRKRLSVVDENYIASLRA